jgi:hypothetical protein
MENIADDRMNHIEGWGADLDPRNRPAHPKERTPPRLDNPPEGPLDFQPVTVEVLHSTERPGITPVFGTACPPAGLSGMIRRQAFRHSENDIRHWLHLLLADRVNVLEGLVEDARLSPRTPVVAGAAIAGLVALMLLRRARR